ncbi:MAG: UpxY family transcription antiterminator [Bacteroides sp.]|nr:UpxY family transcription antiterminator [Bacteroides sp.]
MNSQPSTSNSQLNWYALRITYSRELALKEYLDAEHIENFIPMHYIYVVKGERKMRKLVSVVHNLVFVRTTRKLLDEIKELKGAVLPIRYIMDREIHQPLIIPDIQMRNFIAVAGNYEQQLIYLDPTCVHMAKGTRVRITGGIFEGVEGEFIRIKGDRRVVVAIQGLMAVATAFVHPSLIEEVGN